MKIQKIYELYNTNINTLAGLCIQNIKKKII